MLSTGEGGAVAAGFGTIRAGMTQGHKKVVPAREDVAVGLQRGNNREGGMRVMRCMSPFRQQWAMNGPTVQPGVSMHG